jgi:hypothetical protein
MTEFDSDWVDCCTIIECHRPFTEFGLAFKPIIPDSDRIANPNKTIIAGTADGSGKGTFARVCVDAVADIVLRHFNKHGNLGEGILAIPFSFFDCDGDRDRQTFGDGSDKALDLPSQSQPSNAVKGSRAGYGKTVFSGNGGKVVSVAGFRPVCLCTGRVYSDAFSEHN